MAQRHNKLQKTEIIIPVMGPTGAGKSTFINALLEDIPGARQMKVDDTLTSVTKKIAETRLSFEGDSILGGYSVVVVDTPGFNDTCDSDVAILKCLADWLAKSYRQKQIIGGVVYLHDISHNRFTGTCRRNLNTFHHMCGDFAMSKAIIATTHWSETDVQEASSRECELKEKYWATMLQEGCRTNRFENTRVSAVEILRTLVTSGVKEDINLQIQEELVDQDKLLAETKAGRELRSALQDLRDIQKQVGDLEAALKKERSAEIQKLLEEAKMRRDNLTVQIDVLRISFRRKVKRFFGLI